MEVKSNRPSCGSICFPGDDRQDGVEIALRQLGPDRLHVGAARGAGIVQFAGQGIRNGLPSTISWRAPCRSFQVRLPESSAARAVAGDASCAAARARQMVRRCVFIVVSLIVGLLTCLCLIAAKIMARPDIASLDVIANRASVLEERARLLSFARRKMCWPAGRSSWRAVAPWERRHLPDRTASGACKGFTYK